MPQNQIFHVNWVYGETKNVNIFWGMLHIGQSEAEIKEQIHTTTAWNSSSQANRNQQNAMSVFTLSYHKLQSYLNLKPSALESKREVITKLNLNVPIKKKIRETSILKILFTTLRKTETWILIHWDSHTQLHGGPFQYFGIMKVCGKDPTCNMAFGSLSHMRF